MDNIAYLISQTFSQDAIGQNIPSETRRMIYVSEENITRAEWSAAGRQGHNPEIMLTTPRVNYRREKIVEYNGIRYGIYRTYSKGEDIELYLDVQGGTTYD